MPVFSSIGTEVDACLVANARGWTSDNGQHLRVNGTDGNIHYHHCIEYSALLRPGTSPIGTDK